MKCTKCKVNELAQPGENALSHDPEFDEICKDCEAKEVAKQLEAYFS